MSKKLKYHRCADGTKVLIQDMEDRHLINTIRLFKKAAKKGIRVMSGGGCDSSEIWFDSETVFDEEAEEIMRLKLYLNEARKRNLKVDA